MPTAETMDVTRQWVPYCGAAPGPEDWLGRWNGDPVLLVLLALAGAALIHRPDEARGARRRHALRGAWAMTALLYVSPLCALSSAFFTARVVHHLALLFVLAPLLAFGFGPALRRLPAPLWTSTAIAAITFWTWHAPATYAAAMSSEAVYALMQLTLLASATVFWLAATRAEPALALAAILVSMVTMGLLGALITFAMQPLYAPHVGSALRWGVSPLEDQQLAGLLMWAPGSLAYLAFAVSIGRDWLRVSGGRSPSGATS